MTPACKRPSFGKDAQNQMHAVLHVQMMKHAGEVGPHGRHAEAEFECNLLVTHAAKNALDDSCLLRRQAECFDDAGPGRRIEGQGK